MHCAEHPGRSLTCSFAIGLAFVVMPAQATTILHSFIASEGVEPTFVLLMPHKTLYGVTFAGGINNNGTLYKIDAEGNFSIVHAFLDAPDGDIPNRLLKAPDGSILGLTASGGSYYGGTVYRVGAHDRYKTLHNFNQLKDGAGPNFLIAASDGNFYGTASIGGVLQKACPNQEANGTLFRMTPDGRVTRLHTFCESIDGSIPNSVVEGSDGSLYGTCKQDGPGLGTLWRASFTGKVTVLHRFSGGGGPAQPNGVLEAPDGFLYGVSNGGGNQSEGTIFRATTQGALKVLHSFDAEGSTGNDPETNFVLADDGFFYGSTAKGGLPVDDPERSGTVYRADTSGHVKVLHTFSQQDGMTAVAPPVRDPKTGVLYATAISGGNDFNGTVVKIEGRAH